MVVTLIYVLIISPLLAAGLLLCCRSNRSRTYLVSAAALLIAVCSLGLLKNAGTPLDFSTPHWANVMIGLVETAVTLYLAYASWKARQWVVTGLVMIQAAIILALEWTHGGDLETVHTLWVDKFSVILALINGVIGSGICLFAVGYMSDYHEKDHPETADRRPLFFCVLFLFLASMFGLAFSNNLLWLYAFWELTTLCSFWLIGYTGTTEARRNAWRALTMNLAGGLAFAVAILCAYRSTGTIELQALIRSKQAAVLLPAALLCFAGVTKSAQLPFSSWLLGAMVAPTPVSALLHSSTMVKAGVYLVLRMAPVMTGTKVGVLVALVGGMTFLIGSLAAVTASDAKKVLAYSTVANLGLIVLCGGVGTSAAVWAGLLLILFHAVAKCLLFLCVGFVEHQLHSRDIEAMSGLILNLPRVAVMMLVGMAGMFLAPFGMLISKWAVLKAVVDAYPPLSLFIVFGSAATLFFWVKWMGKLLEAVRPRQAFQVNLAWGQSVALHGLASGTFLTCLFFPLLSSTLIEPYVMGVFGSSVSLGHGNVLIMTIMMIMVLLFPLSFLNYGRGVRVTDAYLGGANLKSSARFMGSAQAPQDVCLNNYYLRDIFNERGLTLWGTATAAALLAIMLALALLPKL